MSKDHTRERKTVLLLLPDKISVREKLINTADVMKIFVGQISKITLFINPKMVMTSF